MKYFIDGMVLLSFITVAGFIGCSNGSGDHVSVVDRPDITSENQYYSGNRAPLQPARFLKLPLGDIEPEGWIKKMLELQKDGLAGHLGEISAWLEKDDNAWLAEGGSHGWEEVPYWLRGYADMAFIFEDPDMKEETMLWIKSILESQQEDGWFGPKVRSHSTGHTDFWPNMIVLFTLQHYYEYSGDERVIDFMTNYFRYEMEVEDEAFLSSYWENSRGGDNLYSVYWLYNITGDEWLLKLAEKVHRNTANWMQQSNLPNWHNVNIAQCFREPATWFVQSGDSTHLNATYNNYQLIRRTFGQVPGGMFGADENARMGYIDPRQGTETCGFAEQMTSDGILTRITGDPKWADNCEDVLFNSFPAAFTSDMKSLRYITCPNGVTADSLNHSPGIQNAGPFLMMNPFSSRCCQHNHGHALPYYLQNLVKASNDNGVAAIMYNSCKAKVKVGDNGTEVMLHQDTRYPFEEEVRFRFEMEQEAPFPFYLRVPGWCDDASVTINGETVNPKAKSGSYIVIQRNWKNDDEVVLHLPMELSLQTWQVNQNSVSVNYGPLTFSLKIDEAYEALSSTKTAIWDSRWQEGADPEKWPSYQITPQTPWNYGLMIDKDNLAKSFSIIHNQWPEDDYPFSLENAPVELRGEGRRIPSWQIDQYGLVDVLPMYPVHSHEPVEKLSLVPMGCARLRISSFPLVQ